jgi:hypothetical protein
VEPCLEKLALNRAIVAFHKLDKANGRSFEIDCLVFEKGHLWFLGGIFWVWAVGLLAAWWIVWTKARIADATNHSVVRVWRSNCTGGQSF